MAIVNIKSGLHNWEKQNLITIKGRGGMYDELKCSHCGMKGRTYQLGLVRVSNSYKAENINLCPKAEESKTPQRIEVIYCSANNPAFSNITPKSQHDIVEPPKGESNYYRGVWVMGVGEPVKLLYGEFKEIDN